MGERAKSAEVSGRGLRDPRELSGRELIPGNLPAGTSKMEKIGGETGACCGGSVRGNFLRPRRTGCACGPRAGACAVRWRQASPPWVQEGKGEEACLGVSLETSGVLPLPFPTPF